MNCHCNRVNRPECKAEYLMEMQFTLKCNHQDGRGLAEGGDIFEKNLDVPIPILIEYLRKFSSGGWGYHRVKLDRYLRWINFRRNRGRPMQKNDKS